MRGIGWAAVAALGFCGTLAGCKMGAVDAPEGGIDTVRLVNAGDDPANWITHGGSYAEQRFSPLDQIDRDSVGDLGLAWFSDMDTARGQEATPLVMDGKLYVTTAWSKVFAYDAATGEPLWSYDPEVPGETGVKACCDVVNRGLAVWGEHLFLGTLDGRLVALDRDTGAVAWEKVTVDQDKSYTITGAPRVVDGKVLIGNGGAEFGVRGYIAAYSADDGEELWRFYTVPGDEGEDAPEYLKTAAETWSGDALKGEDGIGGGGTVWDSMAYDPELNQLYIGVGNGSPWNHGIRSPEGGDNLYLSSIVALNPDNGEYIWHYQTTPAESWDYTAAQHMILAELEIEGRARKVIMQAPKNGFFYVLDRETGEFISANNFVPVTWATHIDPETGRPVEVEAARFFGKEPVFQLPGPFGAHNWMPMSYSPETGLVYIPAQEAPWMYGDLTDYEYTQGVWNTGTNFQYGALPTDVATITALKAMTKGRLIAWDPVSQEAAWSVEHKGPWNGGVLSTKSNLVFQGTADAHFAAYDARNGNELWKFFTQTGIVAAPITYSIDGEQYVAVAAGWAGSFVLGAGGVLPSGSRPDGGRIMVFKLGGDNQLPAIVESSLQSTAPPELLDVGKEVLALGNFTYANRCGVCHGDQAMSYGTIPSLRVSAVTRSADAWRAVLLDGALSGYGMPNFNGILDEDTVEAVRAYVIEQANSGRDKSFYESIGMPSAEDGGAEKGGAEKGGAEKEGAEQENTTEGGDSHSDSEESGGG